MSKKVILFCAALSVAAAGCAGLQPPVAREPDVNTRAMTTELLDKLNAQGQARQDALSLVSPEMEQKIKEAQSYSGKEPETLFLHHPNDPRTIFPFPDR